MGSVAPRLDKYKFTLQYRQGSFSYKLHNLENTSNEVISLISLLGLVTNG
jgi:hypothetical protein